MNGVNAPFGLRPTRTQSGAPTSEAQNQYAIASGYATNIFTWDPVTMLSDGTIGIGVAGAACLGLFVGCKYQSVAPQANGSSFIFSPYWPASTTVKTGTVVEAMVMDSPDLVMEVQETDAAGTGAGTPLALADRNLNINFVVNAGSAAGGGQSRVSINNASEATTATLNLKILDIAPIPGNPVGNFAVWLVTWNNHIMKGGTGTAGV
jgi:hypothetical protein